MKQISYPSFSSRIFAGVMDLCLISFIAGPILSYIHNQMVISEFADFFQRMQVDVSDHSALLSSMRSKEFLEFVTNDGYGSSVIVGVTSLFLQLFAIATYNILCVYKFGATFGKFIIRSKVVDINTLQTPSLKQLTTRYILAWFAFIGYWSILFSNKNQSMHDKFAKTIVVKM
jgi:hypothetical protein